jgi:adenylate cyclase
MTNTAPTRAIFLSYASQDAPAALLVRDALRDAGLEVWFDQNELRGGDAWDASIRRQIRECTLFIPLVSANTDARGEGYFRLEWKLAVERSHLMADDQAFLLPLVIDHTREDLARVPDRFRERQWMRLKDGRMLPENIALLLRIAAGGSGAAPPAASPAASAPPSSGPSLALPVARETANLAAPRLGVCVLPFANMSGDQEQEYFSDGITEDIITDLSKVSALWVAARNMAFAFKGKPVDILQVARQLKASHVLEGSVRKSGNRVRITAQLIDGATGGHVWAERYDRDLSDIFALQDEISRAIVAALKLKLLPEEKKAIEDRGTNNPEAYKLYLMARQYSVTGNIHALRSNEAIIRLCERATAIDPDYAQAWALMASAQGLLRLMLAKDGDGGRAAAERALALNPNLAEAHAAIGRLLTAEGHFDAAKREIETALQLDKESYETNMAAARWSYAMRDFPQAITFFEKVAASSETEFYGAGMLVSSYQCLGDTDGARRAARRALTRCEKAVALEPDNGSAMGFLVTALAMLGERERTKEWIERAMLLDPDNLNMQYNFACALIKVLGDIDAGLELLQTRLQKCRADSLNWMRQDPDMDPVREHPRYQAMFAAAEARLAGEG